MAAAGGKKFLVVGAEARDAPARIAARRTDRAWVLQDSQAIFWICLFGGFVSGGKLAQEEPVKWHKWKLL